jgi:DivIVA domain-containing protein
MASMDVTPQELRDIEIREAWRGYHRDDVDELLERAAATIEHLEAEAQQLRARAAQGAPAPAQAPAPAPQAAPVVQAPPVPAPVRSADTDVIQRTLVLAQKAADEAVAEARVKAQQMVGEAEHRSQQVVSEAEANAATIAERERSKLEGEIDKLQTARDTLNADVDALEQFEGDYRDRLRTAIQSELELLKQATAIGQRPALHDVELPAVSAPASWRASSAPAAPTAPPAPPAEDSWSASAEGAVRPVAEPPSAGQATVHIEAVAAGEEAWDSGPAGGWNDPPTAAVVDDSGEYGEVEPGAPGDSLDDDAFFASLREAVRDDAPLGTNDDDAAFFDEEDTEEHRRLFKRRK